MSGETQNIPCSVKRKIVGQILIDHALSYALTATADVPAIYIQQFWKTIKQVSNTNDTIHFMIDRETITYIVDMFRNTLKLPVETLNNPFIEPVDLKFIQRFLKIVGYEGIVGKVSAFYTKNLAQPWQKMIKVFNRRLTTRTLGHNQTKINILQIFHVVINRVYVDYAGLLWWDFLHCVQMKKDVIQYPHFTKLIMANIMNKFPSISQILEENYHSIKDDILLVKYKEYEKVFVRIDVLTIQPQTVESNQGMNRTPRATRTPTFTTKVTQFKRKSKAVVGELRKSEVVDDGDVNDNVDKEKKNDDVEEKKDNKNDDNDDHVGHTLIRGEMSGSLETRNEQTQTPIPSPSRSPRTDLSSDKTLSEELTANVSPTPNTTSKDPNVSQEWLMMRSTKIEDICRCCS
uniref:Synaptobrevin, longin-like domain protein n=1 Tax=Tanacetum cinerariifolium TaxID=118510 RepID=A0A699GR44_TANCI|nr:hypothetical protein [Tanacetum cinerariifolium]